MIAVEIAIGDRTMTAEIGDDGRVAIGDTSYQAAAIAPGVYRVSDGVSQWTVAIAGPAEARWIFVNGQVDVIEVSDQGRRPERGRQASGDLAAPMPATVVRIVVEPGARVARGDTLVILEAMKMELPIRAPRDGVVRAVHCTPGELVQPGVALLDLE